VFLYKPKNVGAAVAIGSWNAADVQPKMNVNKAVEM
jgi:hypothetical protein